VSGRVGGADESDEAVLVQLAHVASVAIENARLTDQLREHDRRKDEFLAILAHELRNPLAPLRTGLSILDIADAPRAARTRAMMGRQLGNLVRLVDDLLDVSRITLGKVSLRAERLDLARVVEDAVDTARPLLEARQHRLEVALPNGPVAIDGDPTRLSQVLANLLSNAAKYTPERGRIALVVAQEGATAVIRVVDDGVGIAPAMLPRVFDLFTQVAGETQSGLGIGLTLARRLVALHGGTVEAESPGPGQGSTFTVRLPVAGGEPRDAGHVDPPERAGGPLRVLVVDDNVDAAEAIALMLGLEGHAVRVAHDGRSALALAAEEAPDVVLLDIGMPGMNGYEVARELRDRAARPRPFLVALTGWGADSDRSRSRDAGFDEHLVKPVDVHDLVALLARATAT
nr:response regulator [Deltaproteobacteria bacterium]